jgi:hypothetical protein
MNEDDVRGAEAPAGVVLHGLGRMAEDGILSQEKSHPGPGSRRASWANTCARRSC